MDLITGVTGMMGGAVLAEARKTGKPFKAMYRNAGDAVKAPAGVATVIADYADKESMRKAFDGIDTLYLVCSPIPQLVELENNAIDVCAEKGVHHVVLNSSLGGDDYPKSFPAMHHHVQEKLKSSGIAYTILQPNSFMQNLFTSAAPTVRTQGAFYAAMGNAKMSMIDMRDIATVVVNVLREPAAHAGKSYELNGPEALTFTEVATKFSRATGRPVQYVDIEEAAQRKALQDQGLPEWLVTALLDLQQYYTVAKKGGDVTDDLQRLLGRTPITLDQFLDENKESFRAQAAGA
jgi:uncharacterized protein YbjT (DUF2867 family)